MVRIPEAGRFELRLMDGAANPYLLQAGLLAGGLDGVNRQLDPGRRLDINMYEPGAAPAGIPRLPLNLLDALRAFGLRCRPKQDFEEPGSNSRRDH